LDLFVAVSIVVSFAALVTAHVALCAALAARAPWWRGALSLVVPILAPVWGFREGMRRRAFGWIAAGLAYVALRVIGHATAR
jgi:hypothetical protein